jgi:hypothetical protein
VHSLDCWMKMDNHDDQLENLIKYDQLENPIGGDPDPSLYNQIYPKNANLTNRPLYFGYYTMLGQFIKRFSLSLELRADPDPSLYNQIYPKNANLYIYIYIYIYIWSNRAFNNMPLDVIPCLGNSSKDFLCP